MPTIVAVTWYVLKTLTEVHMWSILIQKSKIQDALKSKTVLLNKWKTVHQEAASSTKLFKILYTIIFRLYE
jgi:hypothetical protein